MEMRPGIEPGASNNKLGRKGGTSTGNCEGETSEAKKKKIKRMRCHLKKVFQGKSGRFFPDLGKGQK